MSCEAQAGKCTWETLTIDMFSKVTINSHKCHVSGFKEHIHVWQALLYSHVKVLSIKIYKLYVMGTQSGKLEHKRFWVHIAKCVFHKLETFKVKPITYHESQMLGMYSQTDLSTKNN